MQKDMQDVDRSANLDAKPNAKYPTIPMNRSKPARSLKYTIEILISSFIRR